MGEGESRRQPTENLGSAGIPVRKGGEDVNEGIRNLGAGVPVPYDELIAAVQTLTNAALNGKDQS